MTKYRSQQSIRLFLNSNKVPGLCLVLESSISRALVSRLWYTMSWLEEKARLWAHIFLIHPLGVAVEAERGQGKGTSTPPPIPGIRRANQRAEWIYGTLQDWGRHLNHRHGSVLDDQECSHVGPFKEAWGAGVKGQSDKVVYKSDGNRFTVIQRDAFLRWPRKDKNKTILN